MRGRFLPKLAGHVVMSSPAGFAASVATSWHGLLGLPDMCPEPVPNPAPQHIALSLLLQITFFSVGEVRL